MRTATVILISMAMIGFTLAKTYEERRDDVQAAAALRDKSAYMIEANVIIPRVIVEKYGVPGKQDIKKKLLTALDEEAEKIKAELASGVRTKRSDGYIDYDATLQLFDEARNFLSIYDVEFKL